MTEKKEIFGRQLLPEEEVLWFRHQEIDYLHVFLSMFCGAGGVLIIFAVFLRYVFDWTRTYYFVHTDIAVPPLLSFTLQSSQLSLFQLYSLSTKKLSTSGGHYDRRD